MKVKQQVQVCMCVIVAKQLVLPVLKLIQVDRIFYVYHRISDTVLQIDNRSGVDMNNTDTHKSIVASGPTGELVLTPSHENFAITIWEKWVRNCTIKTRQCLLV